jgi:hypothetical protein
VRDAGELRQAGQRHADPGSTGTAHGFHMFRSAKQANPIPERSWPGPSPHGSR